MEHCKKLEMTICVTMEHCKKGTPEDVSGFSSCHGGGLPKHTMPWPAPKHELDKFKHPSVVEGYSEFVLRNSAVQPVVGSPTVNLLLFPKNPMLGAPVVAKFDRNFECEVTCGYPLVSAVAAAITRAEVFLRNLYEHKQPEDSECTPLPVDCMWVEPAKQGELPRVYDKQYGIEYSLVLSRPPTGRGQEIQSAIMEEWLRLRHKQGSR